MSFGWSGDGPSGLSVAMICPDCGRPHGLSHESKSFGYDECQRCRGAFVSGEDARELFYDVLKLKPQMLAELVHGGQPTDRFCLDCGQSTVIARLRGTRAEVCTSCRGTWIPKGGLHRLTNGRYGSIGPKSSSSMPPAARLDTLTMPKASTYAGQAGTPVYPKPPAPARSAPRVRRRSRWPMRVALGFFLLVTAGMAWMFVSGGLSAFAMPSWLTSVAATPQDEVAAVTPVEPPAPPPTESNEVEHVFGGRTLTWWTTRLNALALRDDEDAARLFALTKARAEANGLTLEKNAGRLTVRPSSALSDRMGLRLEKP